MQRQRVLVSAATGYIGRHLIGPLAEVGYTVRASARRPDAVKAPEGVQVVAADALDEASTRASLEGVDTAFYLVHTLGGGGDYAERDRNAAAIFARAAAHAGVRRIVFLGGLGRDVPGLSEHLSSRHEVGEVLASEGVPVAEFRASIVIGSGSTSFEMVRNLVEKLPVMTTPKWVRQPAQPISLTDVVSYLVDAVELPPFDGHRVYEIGGEDVVSYGALLRLYDERRGLHRLIIPVPVLSPGLSGWWLYLFTPKEATVGRQLAESLKFPTVVTDDRARRDFPRVRPLGASAAIDLALVQEDQDFARTLWGEELPRGMPLKAQRVAREGRVADSRTLEVACPPEAAFDPVACIGGERGWYAYDTLWDLRGFFDVLLGGPGRRRGRRDPYALLDGDVLEWWRVERVDPPRLLRLVAEMKMPGRGWLQYEIQGQEDCTLVRQTAIFEPKGVLGRLYWYAILPFHEFVFRGTLKGIERECRALVEGPNTCPLPGEHERGVQRRLREKAS